MKTNISQFVVGGVLAVAVILVLNVALSVNFYTAEGQQQQQQQQQQQGQGSISFHLNATADQQDTVSQTLEKVGYNMTVFEPLANGSILIEAIPITATPTTATTTETEAATTDASASRVADNARRMELATQDPDYARFENFYADCHAVLQTFIDKGTGGLIEGNPQPEPCLEAFEETEQRYCGFEAFDAEKCELVTSITNSYEILLGRALRGY